MINKKIENKLGSLETIRETTFNFDEYEKVIPDHKKKLDPEFLEYFIGFFEGDGSLSMNSQTGRVDFGLYQHSRDLSFLHNIRTQLGFGRVYLSKTRPSECFLKISNEKNLLKIIHLLNGNLCSVKRRKQFKIFLEMFNKKYNRSISLKLGGPSVSLDTAWLSGFIDAEGCFSCHVSKRRVNSRYYTVHPTFYISQKTQHIIEDIRNLFMKTQSNVYWESSWDGYTFKSSGEKVRRKLIQYLQRYKLKTGKRMAYLNWKNIHFFVQDKHHLSDQGSKTILSMIKRIQKINQRVEDRVRS